MTFRRNVGFVVLLAAACGGRPLSTSRSLDAGGVGSRDGAGADANPDGLEATGGRGATGGSGGSSPATGGAGGSGAGAPGEWQSFLPVGCEARNQSEDARTCMLSAFCGPNPHVTDCEKQASGRWRCTSAPRHPERTYELDGVAGLQACAVAAGLDDQETLTLGSDACVPLVDVDGPETCRTEMVCGPLVTASFVRPGVSVRLARYGVVECLPRTSGGYDCQFWLRKASSSSTSRDDLSLRTDERSCRSLLELAMAPDAPGASPPGRCLTTEATAVADGCHRSELCSFPPPELQFRDLPRLGGRFASCEAEPGGAACSCGNGETHFAFHVASAPVAATCAAHLTACDAAASIKATGDVTCQRSSETLSSNGCEGDWDCRQPATVDGRPITANGRLLVSCLREAPGRPWACACASDQLGATFPLGTADATPSQACARAPAECQKRIPVHLGPYGPFMSPPRPQL